MKKYVKPTIDILELRVNENIALKYNNGESGVDTPISKYTLSDGNGTLS